VRLFGALPSPLMCSPVQDGPFDIHGHQFSPKPAACAFFVPPRKDGSPERNLHGARLCRHGAAFGRNQNGTLRASRALPRSTRNPGPSYDGIGKPRITRKVSRAISNSSLVGMTKIRMRLEAAEISLVLPTASLFRARSIS